MAGKKRELPTYICINPAEMQEAVGEGNEFMILNMEDAQDLIPKLIRITGR